MVLRSGIIIPFQYRDTKKLLMIGVPEENRDLSIWDLKNVVRAAFGIYNFEFRNKKIGFNIPDELLLHYLAQRHDLTNFVIEINQAHEEHDAHLKESMSFEPSCSIQTGKQQTVPVPRKSNESHTNDYDNGTRTAPTSPVVSHQEARDVDVISPMEQTSTSSEHGNGNGNTDSTHRLRITHAYSEHTAESLTQSIHPMEIVPKAECNDNDNELRSLRYTVRHLAHQQQQHQQHQQQPPPHSPHATQPPRQSTPLTPQHAHPLATQSPFFPNYTHGAPNTPMSAPPTPSQSSYTPGMMSRFRIFDAQQDAFSPYPSCRCGAAQKLRDSPPPEPTNLCQQAPPPSVSLTLTAPPTHLSVNAVNAHALPPTLCDEEPECLQSVKLRIPQIVHSNHTQQVVKASSSTASELPMATYEPCSPKMDCESQDELADSPHSEQLQHHHHQQQQQQLEQQQQHQEEEQAQHEQMLQERLQHEYILQQQQQQQQQQQHLEAMLQQEQQQNNSTTNAAGGAQSNSIRQRKERMSKRQKELYVSFLQQHAFINEHRRNDPLLDPYWLKLANMLNGVPQGAVKHVTEWKQTFDNWRYRVFLYARYNSKLKGDDALNPRNFKPLTRTDKHAYAIWIRNPDTAPPDLDKMRNVFVNLEDTQQE